MGVERRRVVRDQGLRGLCVDTRPLPEVVDQRRPLQRFVRVLLTRRSMFDADALLHLRQRDQQIAESGLRSGEPHSHRRSVRLFGDERRVLVHPEPRLPARRRDPAGQLQCRHLPCARTVDGGHAQPQQTARRESYQGFVAGHLEPISHRRPYPVMPKTSATSASTVGCSLPNSTCGTLTYAHVVSVSSVAFSHQIVAARSLWATSMSSRPLVSMT